MRRVAILICAAACGRFGFDPVRSTPDARDADAPASETGVADCWPAWTTGPLSLSPPALVSELASPDNEGDPWLSRDGLSLYFSRGATAKDRYLARRADRSSPWGTPELVADLSSAEDDTKLALTDDGLLAIWSSDRAPATSFDLWQATRASLADTFGAPSRTPLAALNDNRNQYDPHLSADGLRLYFAPDIGGGIQEVRLATRATRADPFGAGVTVPLAESVTADPTLSPDELVIIYSAPMQNTPGELFYATRSAVAGAFSAGQLLPIYEVSVHDQDPAISYDGCELYFASLRGGVTPQLYVTFVQ